MSDVVDFSAWPPPPDQTAETPPPRRRRRPWRVVYWVTFGLLCAALVGSLVGLYLTLRLVRASGPDMAPTVRADSLLFVERGAGGVARGDVVLVQSPAGLVLRRLIGLPGDRVSCCDSAGRLDVDGKALAEDYLAPGVDPSLVPFSVTLGPNQAWLMADERGGAYDSRSWGPLAMSAIEGRVITVDESGGGGIQQVQTPAAFVDAGLAPPDQRTEAANTALGATMVALPAVLVQATVGFIRWAVRRSRRTFPRPDLTRTS